MTRDLSLVAISMLTWGLGEGMFVYFQSLYLQQWGAEPVAIGGILGAFGIAMAVAQTPAGYLTDRLGARPLMWFTWILGAASAWIMALAGSLPVFILGLLLYGLTAAAMPPLNIYVTAVRGKLSAARALTLITAAYSLGAVLGPITGGTIADSYGLRTVYIIAASVLIVSCALVLLARRPPTEFHSDAGEVTGLRKNRNFLVLVGLTVITFFALYFAQPLTPNYLQNVRGLSLQEIGMAGTIGSLGIVVITLALGHLPAEIGFLVGQPLMALFSILIWRGNGLILISAGYFFLGGHRLSRSMMTAHARTFVQPSETGLAFGLLETSNAVAIILAPLLAGVLYDIQPNSIYPVALLLITAALIINLLFLPGLNLARLFSWFPFRPLENEKK